MGTDRTWTLYEHPQFGWRVNEVFGDLDLAESARKNDWPVIEVVEEARLREAEAELADERNRVLGLRQTFNAETELRWKVEAELRELVTASEGVALSASWHEPQSRRLAAALDRARGVLDKEIT